ncbi:MAG: hypothetical protein EP329_12215 [Deltaproteobacteria bacterium]|nr:MAG: hypothetical protein EP329_12215 [Deltaproteobacteria bacterium]
MSPRSPLLLGLVAGALLLGCASTEHGEPKVDPAHQWASTVRERIVAARDQPSYTLRYNPAACDCPPFEIRLGEVWHRVLFAGAGPDDETIQALDAAVQDARARRVNATWQIQGSLDDALTTCARGLLVVSLSPSAFGAPPAVPAEE